MASNFPAEYAAARTTLDWAVKATAPLDADLIARLRAFDAERYAACEAEVAKIAKALPFLQAIHEELAARACHRCCGTGEYGGASSHTRNGRKYCFTCNGRGYATAPAAETTPAPRRGTDTDLPAFPAGRYAVDNRFYKIDRHDEGRWAGRVFIRELDTHGNEITDVRAHADKLAVCNAIAADPHGTLIAYGKATGTCGKCHLGLKDPESVARGIGPYCEADVLGISVNAVYRERKTNPAATPALTNA